MFKDARLKLTGWYLLIIMTLSVMFSVVLYGFMVQEVVRLERVQRSMLEQHVRGQRWGMGIGGFPANQELIDEIRNRVLWRLIYVNLGILVFSGISGYWLAGKTLSPIEEMLNKQSRFVSDASHELRTPLTALKTSFEVFLRNKKKTMKAAESVIRDGEEEVMRLKEITDNLLTQVRNGDFKLASMKPLVETLRLARSRIEPIAEERNIKIKANFTDNNPRVVAESYERVWTILLDNAVKYSPDGGVVKVVANLGKKTSVRIIDQGIGIKKKHLSHVFDRFYRADESRSRHDRGGYGLGLAIARELVEAAGGSIKIESKYGNGTEVEVIL